MCGILLIYSKKKKLSRPICEKAFEEIKNRGPDKFLKEYLENDRLFIGNTILSIVGKKKTDNKLYKSDKSRFKIAYNGEIYNYKDIEKDIPGMPFNNDTELLVNLFEHYSPKKIPNMLDGMFAFCVYDKIKKNLFFSSDVQGEKKLFVFNDKNYFICSSNIKAITSYLSVNEINTNKLIEYFDTRHMIFYNSTIYKKIRYIMPGKIFNLNLKRNKIKEYTYDNPINWINKKKYNKFKNLKIDQLVDHFEKKIIEAKNKMLPNVPFMSLFSGGIDSSLQSKYLDKSKNLKGLLFVDHNKKDPIAKKIFKFKKYLTSKVYKIQMNEKDYAKDLKKTYRSLMIPFLTHDLVGINKCFEFVRKKKCKVVFNAGGVDELFGGYKLYKKNDWSQNKINLSPYSSYSNIYSKKIETDYKKNSDIIWKKAFIKYRSFTSVSEAKIQASLFTDYFVQAVGVHNVSWHLLGGENSIEVRNFFINKSIIKEVINLPIEYKINNKLKNNFSLKFLLKKIFSKNFNKNLVFKKQGFSGFPNESSKYLNDLDKKSFDSLIYKFKNKIKLNRDNYWKILNIFYFKKFCVNKLKLLKFVNNF